MKDNFICYYIYFFCLILISISQSQNIECYTLENDDSIIHKSENQIIVYFLEGRLDRKYVRLSKDSVFLVNSSNIGDIYSEKPYDTLSLFISRGTHKKKIELSNITYWEFGVLKEIDIGYTSKISVLIDGKEYSGAMRVGNYYASFVSVIETVEKDIFGDIKPIIKDIYDLNTFCSDYNKCEQLESRTKIKPKQRVKRPVKKVTPAPVKRPKPTPKKPVVKPSVPDRLTITSYPTNAKVIIEGEEKGNTLYTWNKPLIYGQVKISVEKNGYISKEMIIQYTGGTVKKHFVLVRGPDAKRVSFSDRKENGFSKPISEVSVAAGFKYDWYLRSIEDKVKRYWSPSVNDPNLSVVLMFVIYRDGKISDIKIKERSGNTALDNLAIRAVKLAAPFGRLPPKWGRELSIEHKLIASKE